jgi:hypothetical protein
MGWLSTLTNHDEHVRAIGMISIEHGNMEIFLGHLLTAILDVPYDVGQGIFWCPQSAAVRRLIVKTAAEQTFKPRFLKPTMPIEEEVNAANKSILDAIKKVIKRAETLTGKRHSKVHDLWGTHSETGDAVVATTKSFTSDEEPRLTPLKELNEIIYDLRRLIDEIQKTTNLVKRKNLESEGLL